ncbi:MAG: beta-ketoacyl synthase chain length factor [Prevotellaceae bacterium]|jgi:hypothetical protein|nr:beta-ketoacyl synthase chain length factor [Prevotellaceae bacterium]
MKKRVYINATSAISPNGVKGEDNILHAIEPDYKDIITNANLRRRMSHIVKMGVACGLLCLEKNGDRPINAIITATGLGCLADTEKFLNSIIENEERLLNPTAFTQSTFNVIGAQIALLTNNHCYNNTFVHRGLSFESALIDTMMQINEGDSNVLVGAIDEATPTTYTILKGLGLIENITMGEGAQFFVLSNENSATNNISLKGVKTYSGKYNSAQQAEFIKNFLADNSLNTNDISCFITGDNGMQDSIYTDVNKLFPSATNKTFKDICGEYPTASSYGFYLAVDYLENHPPDTQNVLIYNAYNNTNHSLILLEK